MHINQMLDAAEEGQEAECKALLAQNADVTYASKNGVTALHKASANGHVATAALLLEHKAVRVTQISHGTCQISHVTMLQLQPVSLNTRRFVRHTRRFVTHTSHV